MKTNIDWVWIIILEVMDVMDGRIVSAGLLGTGLSPLCRLLNHNAIYGEEKLFIKVILTDADFSVSLSRYRPFYPSLMFSTCTIFLFF